ncbi:FtsX-like permease family protein [Candidatus Parabeggiatoa sp. HSG14]|uniref:ABC transporter permease n=1 Tax=Candidatus Parabeggiatoa sp. HSG14 TaxID=3055593 RepID=UPI0025A71F52|nr:hypothetical protein [Thiotrichales bacterium HSG14]
MNAWQKLAWIEWYRSFRMTGKDNHDFFWLGVLLFLTLTLALLLWGSREGLLNKFVDVSLGHIEGVGIPIWVIANNPEGIDRELLEQSDIKFHPYREVERYEVALPMNDLFVAKIWDEKIPFNGWAVSTVDPLWQLSNKKSISANSTETFTIPLEITLNESLFKQYFNCAAYVETVQQQMPFWTPPPISKEKSLYCLANNILWLDIKVGTERRELLPFNIHWQTRIPTMHQIAFLFPLSTLHTLKVSNYFTHLKYYPEAQSNKDNRIKELMIWADKIEVTTLEQLKTCLGNAQIEADRISLKYPLPKNWVIECIQQSGIPLQKGDKRLSPPYFTINEESESHYFQYDNDDHLTVLCEHAQPSCQPCQSIFQSSAWNSLENTVCTNIQTITDMMALIGSYQKALVYVKNRAELANHLEQIKNLPQSSTDNRKAFYIHPTYNNAYVRFLFIQKVIDMLKVVYSPFFLIFLIILLTVQIGIVITHRKHNYGILLSKGVSWWQIYQIILMQITLSFFVALCVATLIVESVRSWLRWEFADIVMQKPYIDHILVSNFDLLPISLLDYSLVSIVTLLISYLIATKILRHTIPAQHVEPAYLFKL